MDNADVTFVKKVMKQTGWPMLKAQQDMDRVKSEFGVCYEDYYKAGLYKVSPEEQLDKWKRVLQKRENKKFLVVVLTRNLSTGLSVIRSLGSAGFIVDAIGSANKAGRSRLLELSRYVRNYTEVVSKKLDGVDNEEILEVLLSYKDCGYEKVLLFPTDDHSTSVINFYKKELSEVFIFPGITDPMNGMDHYMNKAIQCAIASTTGLLVPKTFIVSLRNDPLVLPEGVQYPCFCKPVSSYTGMKTEMTRCDSEEELLRHLKIVQARFSDRDFIVQDYLDIDYEMAVEGYTYNGHSVVSGVVRKERVANWETGVSVVGRFMSLDNYDQLKENVQKVVGQIPYNGLFDMDLIYSKGRIYFTELNFRSGGLTYVFVKNGVNLPALFVRNMFGMENLPEQEEADQYNTTFLYEIMAWQDVLHGYMTRKELEALAKQVDIRIMDDNKDPEPYQYYLEDINEQYESLRSEISHKKNYFNLSDQEVDQIWDVVHETKDSWTKAQSKMTAACSMYGIDFSEYIEKQMWTKDNNKTAGENMFNFWNNGEDNRIDISGIDPDIVLERLGKMSLCQAEDEERQDRISNGMSEDDEYEKADTRVLIKEERKQVKDFWSSYSFAVAPPYEACEIYTNCSGKFSPMYISSGMKSDIMAWSCPEEYRAAFQNINYIEKNLKNAKTVPAVVRKIAGSYLDSEWKAITEEEGIEKCIECFNQGIALEVVTSQNRADDEEMEIETLPVMDRDALRSELESGTDFLIRKKIEQHPALTALDPGSLNTLKLTTIYFNDKFELLSGLVKVGDSFTGTWDHNGYLIGLNEDGTTSGWALDPENNKVRELTLDLYVDELQEIPYYQEAVSMVLNCHREIPMVKIVSWDIAISVDGPVLLKLDLDGDMSMHQAVNGPIFGEKTQAIMDEIYGESFYRRRADFNYDYHEYVKHAAIIRYANNETEVLVPSRFNGKRISRIGESAFRKKRKIRKIVISEGIKWISADAFRACSALEEVVLPSTVQKIGKRAFRNCDKLTKINIGEGVTVHKTAFEGCSNLKINQ